MIAVGKHTMVADVFDTFLSEHMADVKARERVSW